MTTVQRITLTRPDRPVPFTSAPLMSGPEVVLFDFGGTLDADGVHWAPRFYAAYQAGGGAVEYPAFESGLPRVGSRA